MIIIAGNASPNNCWLLAVVFFVGCLIARMVVWLYGWLFGCIDGCLVAWCTANCCGPTVAEQMVEEGRSADTGGQIRALDGETADHRLIRQTNI